jgi:hypothetical protein
MTSSNSSDKYCFWNIIWCETPDLLLSILVKLGCNLFIWEK